MIADVREPGESTASETYRQWARRQARATQTIAVQGRIIDACERSLGVPLAEADPDAVADWLTRPGRSRETMRAYACALRAAAKAGACPPEVVAALPRIRVPAHQPHPCPEPVVEALLRAPDPYDMAAVVLMAYAGCRVSEVPTVTSDDIEVDAVGGCWLRVVGKGEKERLAPFPAWAGDLVRSWLPIPRSARRIQARIPALMRAAGWHGSCHDLRHRYASQLLRGCHDVLIVRDALGHASVATTMVYCQADRPAATLAVEALPRPRLRVVS